MRLAVASLASARLCFWHTVQERRMQVADARRIELRDKLQPLPHRELLQAVFDT
ncbi:hypothetical protein [Ralstonia solanacearum]|uniref:hypothetical protein n=1 Tax=Ralstonia solanacearum TaxID=305 RepID=UPI0013C319E4|nr:hypothetical protein [Ralstonia solanacearum]